MSESCYWHGYCAEIPGLVHDKWGNVGPALAFTTIADTRQDARETYQGVIWGHELTFVHVATWDHEPSEQEKETVQPERYRLTKGEGR
jgi:hypothetical protein